MTGVHTLELDYGAKHIIPQPLTIASAKGAYLFDDAGQRYLDMVSGISVTNFGHQHPRLIKALYEQASKVAVTSRLFHSETLGPLLARACELSGMDKGLPMNTGAEAVETAIKAARKWGYIKKGLPENQAEVIVAADNFHGRTITTISLSSVEKYKNHFGPLTPGFKCIPFNNPDALEKAITPNTAAFLVEPIQGEAGVVIPDAGYLKQCQHICKAHNVLLICDEIQSGMGRTGKFLASHYEAVSPDGILLGKALGGGLLPISLFLAKNHLMDVFEPGDHGSTFGGNPLAAAVAYEALNTLIDEDLISRAAQVGAYFLAQLNKINSVLIKSVRGKGLFIGIEIKTDKASTSEVCQQLMCNGLLTINTRGTTIRLLPPLTINQDQVDQAVEIIGETFVTIEQGTVIASESVAISC